MKLFVGETVFVNRSLELSETGHLSRYCSQQNRVLPEIGDV